MDKTIILRRFCDLAKIDSSQRVAEWLASLGPDEIQQAKEQITYYLPRESLAGLNEIGAYVLSLPDDEISHLVLAKLADGPGLSCNLVSFLIKYDPNRVERLYRNWVGQGLDTKGYCHIESDLVAHGYLDALPALEVKASKVSNGSVAIALAKQLYHRDPHKYQKLAIKVATKAMKDSWHAPSGCEWLIDLQGEAALPAVIARLRKPVDCSVKSVARHAVTALGFKAEPLMEFALKEDDNSLVLGAAEGIVQAQLPTVHPIANKVFLHLIENLPDAWLMNIMEQLGRWNPSLLMSHSKRFLSSPDSNIRSFFQNAVKGLPTESSTVAPPDSNAEFQQRLIDTIPLDYQAFVKAEATPCLCLQTIKATAPIPCTQSKMGGLPDVPDDFVWPLDESGLAFTFVARLAESDIQRIDPTFEGSLLFFADIDDCRSSGAVIHLPHQLNSSQHRCQEPSIEISLSARWKFLCLEACLTILTLVMPGVSRQRC